MKQLLILFFLGLIFFASTTNVDARTTPADIVGVEQQSYEQKLSTYSPATQTRIKNSTQAIANMNKKQTDELEMLMERQGQILDEYMRRKGITYRVADGVNRNLTDPVENANYWITYAHEAVAYQAAKHYIPSLGAESAWRGSLLNEVANLQADINVLKGKVEKSRILLEGVVNK